jgi:hypothetical protein
LPQQKRYQIFSTFFKKGIDKFKKRDIIVTLRNRSATPDAGLAELADA